MKKILLYLQSLVVFISLFSFSYAANVGDEIINRVSISYNLCGSKKEKKLNEVKFNIAPTPATIEFLASNLESNDSYSIQTTYYKDKNSITHPINKLTLANGLELTPPFNVALKPVKEYFLEDLIFIKVTDIDQNTHIDKIDTIEITILNPYTQDKEKLILQETKANSGIFIGYIPSTSKKKEIQDGSLYIQSGNKIFASYLDGNKTITSQITQEASVVDKKEALFVIKKANKKEAAPGDFVKYTIIVKNLQNYPLYNLKLYDKLPLALSYKQNSFQTTDYNSTVTLKEKTIQINIDSIAANSQKEFSYIAEVGATKETLINQAWVENYSGVVSNRAFHKLFIKNDLFINKGLIVGKVYNPDCKEQNSSCKYGIEGVKIYMEDGRYTITDKEGKFHFIDVSKGVHLLQIDPLSIKNRYKLRECKKTPHFANRTNSTFVEIFNSELKQVNFCLEAIKKATQKTLFKLKASAQKNQLILHLELSSTAKLIKPEVYISLPDGIEYNKTLEGNEAFEVQRILVVPMDKKNKTIIFNINPYYPVNGALKAALYYDTALEKDQRSSLVSIYIAKKNNKIIINKNESKELLSNQTITDPNFHWKKKSIQQTMPKLSKELVDRLGKKAKIIWPPKGWVPYLPSTKIAILRKRGTYLELTLNGKKISVLNYQKLFRSSDKTMQIDYYKGVDLANGRNIIKAVIKDKNKKILATLTREIWVESGLAKEIVFLEKESFLKADGEHTPIIAVRFLGESKHPLRGGLVGNYEIEGDYEPYKRLNGKGVFKIESNGTAYIRLKPTSKAGKVTLHFTLANNKKATITANLKPALRDWFIVGFAQGTIGYKKIHSHIEKIDKSKIDTDAQIAFFAKGMIKGKWLLTLSYNSKKEKRALFDNIDPNKYYLLYQDESEQKSEAPSQKKLYLKLEKDDFYALFGDFKSNINGTKFTNYNRSFTGLISEYEYKAWRVKAFLSETNKVHYKEELRGDGTNGYYYLKNRDILEGSETITIEVRDRLHLEKVLARKKLHRYSDYTIDYEKGRVYFNEAIYSTDAKLNPRYIVVEYDTNNRGKNNYTYGTQIEYNNKKIDFKATAIQEDSGTISSSLAGLYTKIALSKSTNFTAEIARSINKNKNQRKSANALYLELSHTIKDFDAKLWYQKEDDGFGLNNQEEFLSSTKSAGITINKKLNKYYSINSEIYKQSREDSTITRVESTLTYEDTKQSASLGVRYQKNKNESQNYIIANYSKKEKNFSYSITHEQSLQASVANPTTTIISASYKKDTNTTIKASISREDRGSYVKYASQFMLSYKPWEKSLITLQRTMESGADTQRVFDTLRVEKKFILNKFYDFTIGYEHGEATKGNESSFDALNLALNYHTNKRSAHIGLSARSASNNKKLSLNFGYHKEISKEQSLAIGAKSNMLWDKDKQSRDSSFELSYAYRPLKGKSVFLDKLEFKENYTKEQNRKEHTLKFINNLHFSYKDNKWEYGAQYGIKYLIDNIDNKEYYSLVDFLALWAQYDLSNGFLIGGQLFALHSYSAHNIDYGFGLFIRKSVWENAELTLGYNFKAFDEDDFNSYNNYSNKIYLQFRIKFDQSDLKKFTTKVSK